LAGTTGDLFIKFHWFEFNGVVYSCTEVRLCHMTLFTPVLSEGKCHEEALLAFAALACLSGILGQLFVAVFMPNMAARIVWNMFMFTA
jgi:hypothetical protein